MRLLYISGPYRSDKGVNGIAQNIQKAREIARRLWLCGYAVICPHLNTGLMDGPDIPDQVWLEGDFEMVKRCDGIVMMYGWEHSEGATAEHGVAQSNGLKIFYLPDDVVELKLWATT